MVPLRLTLRNFLCYAETCPPLDFAGISMACLSGENGHGKTALLDAITWAVWGKARARTDDELIHMGCSDMEVEFEFRVGSVQYRVLRKRRRGSAKSPGRVLLEMQVLSGEEWKPITGSTTSETQGRIIDAVRLDYETFRNSAFLMQGRADEFTIKAPGERKKVLADILGLGAYDRYEERAKEERKTWEATSRRLDAMIGRYVEELSKEPLYERERQETRAELDALEKDLTERRQSQATLREVERSLGLLRAEAERLVRDRGAAQGRVERARAEVEAQEQGLKELDGVLAHTEEIMSDLAALRGAREGEAAYTAKLKLLNALQRDENIAERAIEREAHALQSRLEALEVEAKRHREQAARLVGLDRDRQALTTEHAALADVEKRLATGRAELESATAQAGRLDAENAASRKEMEALKRKQNELTEGGALCPVCRSLLGVEKKTELAGDYEREGKALAAKFRENKAAKAAAEAAAATARQEIAILEGSTTRTRAGLERRAAELDRSEREAATAQLALPALEEQRVELQTTLADDTFAAEAREKLFAVRVRIAALEYDAPAHQTALAAVRRLAGAEAAHGQLLKAEASRQAAQDAIERAWRERSEWEKLAADAGTALVSLQAEIAAQPDPRDQLRPLADEIDGLEAAERRLRPALGAAEQRLEDCRRFRRLHAESHAELTTARRKQQIYEDLAVSFGRKGVQALIIDSVLPEIEEEANRLLARMSNGRMSVALSTQRTTQKGDLMETLDVTIADELGTRAYEMFSGGEAFRINLALRIALSKLLARRAGAPLPTLIVDEGFGTQDTSGRERLLEAMNAVAGDFECLIVITHIDELKDQFDQQIVVEKTPGGSIARVV